MLKKAREEKKKAQFCLIIELFHLIRLLPLFLSPSLALSSFLASSSSSPWEKLNWKKFVEQKMVKLFVGQKKIPFEV